MRPATHLLLLLVSVLPQCAFAQPDTASRDTSDVLSFPLPEATVTAYGHERTVGAAPAGINRVTPKQLNRFSNTSVVQAVNTIPGVRMEERSPGSYRLSIRGSSLRSPFGVRNVKVYYNDIPITDPSGFTYFNQLGFVNINSLQIIRGPGSSMYGAGTGGVILVNSLPGDTIGGASATFSAGSYGLINTTAEARVAGTAGQQTIRFQHLSSDGYRQQSASERNVLSWDGNIAARDKFRLTSHFLYNRLAYQTPGALTLAEYEATPTAARPATGAFQGAAEARASIYQENALAGFSAETHLSSMLHNRTTLYGSITSLNNPTIRNYGRTTEPHYGGRTTFDYNIQSQRSKLLLLAGAEAQRGYVYARTYGNINGNPDTLQADDETQNQQYMLFGQATLQLKRWVAEAGISANRYAIVIQRFRPVQGSMAREYDLQLMPRAAASFNFTGHYFAYVNVARGFSPPTSAEVLPTGSPLNTALQPETGWSYEAGSKGFITDRLYYDASIFLFSLSNAIALRKNAGGGDEYVNSGATDQAGVEAHIAYNLSNKAKRLRIPAVWISYTGYDFRYRTFTTPTADLSGKRLPGVAPHAVSAGVDVAASRALLLNLTWYFSDRMPLNDGNSAYARAYNIADLRINYTASLGRTAGTLFAGVNNILNERYSLGNDINAPGGRYYNAAPGINYYAGLMLSYSQKARG